MTEKPPPAEQELTRSIALPTATQERIKALVQQQQAIGARINETLVIALEALGARGQVLGYDLKTGEAKVKEALAPVPLNRAQRRRGGKGVASDSPGAEEGVADG